MTLPVLGLALERRPSEALVPLLVALFRWCVPATLDPATDRPAALLAVPAALGRAPQGLPTALWVGAGEADAAAAAGAAAIVSDEPAVVAAAGPRGVLATGERHARGRRPVSPFVRERLRRFRGLPPVAVLEQAEDGWRWPGLPEPLGPDLAETALACASAVVVTEPAALLAALAWAAPCVTDAAAAAEAGAVDGEHLLVGADAAERRARGAALAADAALASQLSWAGRRLVERRHDTDCAALRLAELLALRPSLPERALAPARLQLDLLGTPADARIRERFAAAIARLATTREVR